MTRRSTCGPWAVSLRSFGQANWTANVNRQNQSSKPLIRLGKHMEAPRAQATSSSKMIQLHPQGSCDFVIVALHCRSRCKVCLLGFWELSVTFRFCLSSTVRSPGLQRFIDFHGLMHFWCFLSNLNIWLVHQVSFDDKWKVCPAVFYSGLGELATADMVVQCCALTS